MGLHIPYADDYTRQALKWYGFLTNMYYSMLRSFLPCSCGELLGARNESIVTHVACLTEGSSFEFLREG